MNDTVFLKNFVFNEFFYYKPWHNDISVGIAHHFIGYMKHGKGLIVTQEQRLELNTGDMFYIPKGCKYHSYWNTDGVMARFDSIGFRYFPSASPNGYLLQKIPYDEEIMEAFGPLSVDKTINVTSIGCLYQLMGKLEKVLKETHVSRADQVIDKLTVLMNEDSERSIAEYASDCGISESLLYLYVKKKLQKTPNRLRQEISCQKAMQLLGTTNLSVEEICDICGFSSASYFRKVLFSVSGKTPSQVRREANSI